MNRDVQYVVAAYDIGGNVAGYLTIRNTLSSLEPKAARFSDRDAAERHVATRIECWQGWQHYIWVPEPVPTTTSRPVDTVPSTVPRSSAKQGRAGRAVKGRKAKPAAPSR
jgi:hypothetical protein